MPYSFARMGLAQVTLLPTSLTKLTGTNCRGVSAGSAGEMSLPLIGGTRALKTCAQYHEEEADVGGGHRRSSRLWGDGLEDERPGETDFLNPIVRHCFHDRSGSY